jgi:hypothetical protein
LLALPLFGACSRIPEHARVDPALAPLVPEGTTSLAGLRLDLLKKTALWNNLFPASGPGPLEGLRERTGMDIADSLYEVVYCMGGRHRLALLRGKWTNGGVANSGLEPELKIEGGQKLPYKGYVLQGREDAAVVFFNSSVALAGKAAALRDSIDARNAQELAAVHATSMVESLPHDAHIYFVSDAPKMPESGLGGLKSVPFQFSAASAYLSVKELIRFHAEGQSADEESARQSVESLRGILSLLKIDKSRAAWADALRIEQQSSKVAIDADFSLETAAEIVKLLDIGG